MKANAKIYKGIEYIQLSDLPLVQQEKLLQSSQSFFIKIMIDKKIISKCIQYKDYVSWFESEYKQQLAPVAVETKQRQNVELAISNI
ncbi:MAG TPA: hypothetical protein VD884_03010 [Ohtaekwangia sp.]|nr:hypothetical protein [Ohtaekwangia sp.]